MNEQLLGFLSVFAFWVGTIAFGFSLGVNVSLKPIWIFVIGGLGLVSMFIGTHIKLNWLPPT